MTQKILFFTEGNVPTTEELAEIEAIQEAIAPKFELYVRNAAAPAIYGEGRNEPADFIAGSPPESFPEFSEAEAATGTLTVVTNPDPAETISVAGTVFTFVASGATAGQINIGENANATATAIAAAVDALSSVEAEAATNVVTITAAVAGAAGNTIALVGNGAKITRSAATLTGGADASGYPEFDPEEI